MHNVREKLAERGEESMRERRGKRDGSKKEIEDKK